MRGARLAVGLILCGFSVARVLAASEPHVGFAFPAGAQQGTTIEMLIGGQHFKGATNVYVSGEGVTVEIDRYGVRYEPRRLGQLYRNKENSEAGIPDNTGKEREKLERRVEQLTREIELIDLPEGIDPFDKKRVLKYYKFDKKEQFNPQIADRLHVTLHVASDAPAGERELRVRTPLGLSNPVYFQVGVLEEVAEVEPNDDHMGPDLQTVALPSVINGQVRPGDIDHFRFLAKKGDSIVVDVGARRVIPYLADAVPGWFQAVVALYDEDGNEVAYEDDYKFNPDPVLFFDVPAAGTYTLSIRDSIYRGREDFIYRIAIGELPYITSIYPLGARRGQNVDIALSGRNLPKTRVSGKLPDEGMDLRHVSVRQNGYRSNPVPFAIGELPEQFEVEPNNALGQAGAITRPMLVNGRIQRMGDRDVFSFEGEEGGSVSIEVFARRLNSPLDSMLTLTGPGMDTPQVNDDYASKDKAHLHLGAGLVTHHADSYLRTVLPQTGTYYIELADAQGKGGHEYGYRLRVTQTQPDFALSMEPSGIRVPAGGTAVFSVRAMRIDGYEGEIRLRADELPEGFAMSDAVIPATAESTRFTITAPKQLERGMLSPRIVGVADVEGNEVSHPAMPVDDQMQAFLYRHLVPAGELVLAPATERAPVSFAANIPKTGVIEMVAGQTTKIHFTGRVEVNRRGFPIKLDDPPEGFSIEKNGYIGKKRLKEKTSQGEPKYEKHAAWGSILIAVDESVEPGTRFSLVVHAEERRGRETNTYPAPAIPIKVIAP